VTETFNSNSINLVAGIAAPALVVGISRSKNVGFDLTWLMVMTVASLVLLARRRGMGRADGAALVGLYLIFVAAAVANG
jgi:Ca2+/Na+ antiporter